MKVLVKMFSIFMCGGSRNTIEENMLGDQHFLGNKCHILEGRFTVYSISVEYM